MKIKILLVVYQNDIPKLKLSFEKLRWSNKVLIIWVWWIVIQCLNIDIIRISILEIAYTKYIRTEPFDILCLSRISNNRLLRSATLLKKRHWHRCFPVNFVKFLRTSCPKEHLWWLLLNIYHKEFTFTTKTF